jgi:hypothetical protein
MSVLYFGDVSEYLGNAARKSYPDAILISIRNVNQIIESGVLPDAGYTSLGDLPKSMKIVYRLLDLADQIIYFPPEQWSDEKSINIYDPVDSIRGLSDLTMLDFHKLKNNVFLPNDRVWLDHRNWFMDRLADHRRHDSRQLWVAGCSFTYGLGVEYNQRYGQLLSEQLNLPVSWLAAPGSSIEWSADQILRSDIRAGDIVVWGLTGDSRVPLWDRKSNTLVQATIANVESKNNKADISDAALIEILMSDSRLHKSITSVRQVVNYCSKINARLIMGGLLTSHALNIQLSDVSEFEPYLYLKHHPQYFDIGTDKKHPGPLQHQQYAKFFYNQIKRRGYI